MVAEGRRWGTKKERRLLGWLEKTRVWRLRKRGRDCEREREIETGKERKKEKRELRGEERRRGGKINGNKKKRKREKSSKKVVGLGR